MVMSAGVAGRKREGRHIRQREKGRKREGTGKEKGKGRTKNLTNKQFTSFFNSSLYFTLLTS